MAVGKVDIQEKYHIFKDKQLIVRIFLFLVVAIGLNLLFRIPNPVARGAWYLIVATTNASAWLIRLAGIEAQISGNGIALRSQTLLINAECTAIYLMILFAAFVLVYPAKWLRRLIGLVVGIPAIFAANVLRLLLTAWIAEFEPQYFWYFHDYMWQVAFIIFVVVLWLVWIEKVVNYKRKVIDTLG